MTPIEPYTTHHQVLHQYRTKIPSIIFSLFSFLSAIFCFLFLPFPYALLGSAGIFLIIHHLSKPRKGHLLRMHPLGRFRHNNYIFNWRRQLPLGTAHHRVGRRTTSEPTLTFPTKHSVGRANKRSSNRTTPMLLENKKKHQVGNR